MTFQIDLGIQSDEFKDIQHLKENGINVYFSSRQLINYYLTGPLRDKLTTVGLRSSNHYVKIEDAATKVFNSLNGTIET